MTVKSLECRGYLVTDVMTIGSVVFEVLGMSLDPAWKLTRQKRLHRLFLHFLVVPKTDTRTTKKKKKSVLFSLCTSFFPRCESLTVLQQIKKSKVSECYHVTRIVNRSRR